MTRSDRSLHTMPHSWHGVETAVFTNETWISCVVEGDSVGALRFVSDETARDADGCLTIPVPRLKKPSR